MSPVISLEPKHVSRRPKESNTAALVEHAAAVARRLVEDIDYQALGPSSALAGLGLGASAPPGLHLQGAQPGRGPHQHTTPPVHLRDASATMCWRLWFTLPGVEPGEVASFLKSGTLRCDPSLRGLLSAPGRVDHAEKVAELKFWGRRAMVLRTLHRLTPDSDDEEDEDEDEDEDDADSIDESSSTDPDITATAPGASSSSSVRASQLRIIFGATTSDGRLMVVEYPVTHSHCKEHSAESLLLDLEAALEAAAAAPPPPPPAPPPAAAALQPEQRPQEIQEQQETQEQQEQQQQPQQQEPPEQQQQQSSPLIMPRLFLNVYVLIPRQDGGTRVTLHQATCGPLASVLHVPSSPHPDFEKQLGRAAEYVEESVATLDCGGWEKALEMIQRQQKRSALRAVGAADVDDDMRAFLAQMAMDGAEEDPAEQEAPAEAPAEPKKEDQKQTQHQKQKQQREEQREEQERQKQKREEHKGRHEGRKGSEQEAVDGWDAAWAGVAPRRHRSSGNRTPSSDGSIDFVELSDDEGGDEAAFGGSGRGGISRTRMEIERDAASGSGRSTRSSPRKSFERHRGRNASPQPQTRKVKMREVTSPNESSSSLSRINSRGTGTLGFSEVPRTTSSMSHQQRLQQQQQHRQQQQRRRSSDGMGNPIGAVAGVFEEMANNLSKLFERGEALDRVEQKTARMENEASNFASMATQLKEDMANRPWWRRF